MKQLPKLYSNAWLNELKLALKNPNFKTNPPTKPVGVRSDHVKDYSEITKDGITKIVGGFPLTDKEWSNYQTARALIDGRGEN